MRRTGGGMVTGADVAKEAGVSRATVSYVVNGTPGSGISSATRDRVLAVAAGLGYTPYGPARTLKSGQSEVVLFVLRDMPLGHAINTQLDELQARLSTEGLSLVLFRVSPTGKPLSRIWREIGPCAVIGIDSIDDEEADAMRLAGIEVVRVGLGGDPRPGEIVRPQVDVGGVQVRHLASRGHRHLGYAYPDDPRLTSFSTLRLEGARNACAALGLPEIDVQTVGLAPAQAASAMSAWVDRDPPVTAICAYNDQVAFAVLAGLRKHGIGVPDAMAVIGVDNDPTGALVSPTLTSVDIRHVESADRMADQVIAARRGSAVRVRIPRMAPRVVLRESAP